MVQISPGPVLEQPVKCVGLCGQQFRKQTEENQEKSVRISLTRGRLPTQNNLRGFLRGVSCALRGPLGEGRGIEHNNVSSRGELCVLNAVQQRHKYLADSQDCKFVGVLWMQSDEVCIPYSLVVTIYAGQRDNISACCLHNVLVCFHRQNQIWSLRSKRTVLYAVRTEFSCLR